MGSAACDVVHTTAVGFALVTFRGRALTARQPALAFVIAAQYAGHTTSGPTQPAQQVSRRYVQYNKPLRQRLRMFQGGPTRRA